MQIERRLNCASFATRWLCAQMKPKSLAGSAFAVEASSFCLCVVTRSSMRTLASQIDAPSRRLQQLQQLGRQRIQRPCCCALPLCCARFNSSLPRQRRRDGSSSLAHLTALVSRRRLQQRRGSTAPKSRLLCVCVRFARPHCSLLTLPPSWSSRLLPANECVCVGLLCVRLQRRQRA